MFYKNAMLAIALGLFLGAIGCSDTKASEPASHKVPKVQETIKLGTDKVDITIEDEDAPSDSTEVVVVPEKK